MRLFATIFAVLLLFPSCLLAEENGDGYDEHTIRRSDIPADAPKFEDSPAEIYLGENARLSFQSKVAREYRTRLSQWAKKNQILLVTTFWPLGGAAQVAHRL